MKIGNGWFVKIMDKAPADGGKVEAVGVYSAKPHADEMAAFARDMGSYVKVWLADWKTVSVYQAIGALAGRSCNNSQLAAASGVSRTAVRDIVASLRAQHVIEDVSPKGHGAPSWRQVKP
jgi:hypothetical protein